MNAWSRSESLNDSWKMISCGCSPLTAIDSLILVGIDPSLTLFTSIDILVIYYDVLNYKTELKDLIQT
jgi:hypothetical protein